ncbi:MAG: hypothetical protein L0G99_16580, partial [Propionibacteriales bacterium]|nr:hypothetical protein [Propionibacteriales bacterium]
TVMRWQEPWQTRVVVDRARLVRFAAVEGATIRLVVGVDRLDVFGDDAPLPLRMPAVVVGEAMTVAFSAHLLVAALAAGVGPDALFELAGPDQPCVIRSADQATYTAVVMPRSLSPES